MASKNLRILSSMSTTHAQNEALLPLTQAQRKGGGGGAGKSARVGQATPPAPGPLGHRHHLSNLSGVARLWGKNGSPKEWGGSVVMVPKKSLFCEGHKPA